MYIWEVVLFFSPSGYPINSICSVAVRIYNIHVFDEAFFQNDYGHQTFQVGDMLRGALTHKYAWYLNGVVLSDHVTYKIHISTCRRCVNTTLGKVLTKCKRLLNMTLSSGDNVRSRDCLKNLYPTFMRFIANIIGKLLTLNSKY